MTASTAVLAAGFTNWQIDFWFKVNNLPNPPSQFRLFSDDDPISSNRGVAFTWDVGNTITAIFGCTGGPVILTTAAAQSVNVWHHVFLWRAPGGAASELWVDGALVASSSLVLGYVNGLNGAQLNAAAGSGLFPVPDVSFANLGWRTTNTLFTAACRPAFRYALGLLSLEVDIQNVWLNYVSIMQNAVAAISSAFLYSFANTLNASGLMAAHTKSQLNPALIPTYIQPQGLRQITPNAPNIVFSGPAQVAGPITTNYNLGNNITQVNDSTFITIAEPATSPGYVMLLGGWNILGLV